MDAEEALEDEDQEENSEAIQQQQQTSSKPAADLQQQQQQQEMEKWKWKPHCILYRGLQPPAAADATCGLLVEKDTGAYAELTRQKSPGVFHV